MRRPLKKLSTISLLLCFIYSQSTFALYKFNAPLFDNLGTFHSPITTTIPSAQKFFDQGMTLFYGFEWGESIRSFKEATRLDSNCGMCYWGLALTLGANINAPETGREYQEARDAILKAKALANLETPKERGYIAALFLRFQHSPKKVEPKAQAFSCHSSNTIFENSSKKKLLLMPMQ